MNDVREPDQTNVKLDPATCQVMEGAQHEAVDIEDLADSIATLGQLNPVQILQRADGQRLIMAGRRRWMACKSRGLPLVANIWVSTEEDIDLELFARAVRIAENVERCDPSAMDVARQMQLIRNERGFKNARELSEHLGMSEPRVKRYMSIFGASDYLQEMASTHKISLKLMMELTKCERRMGAAPVKKLIARVIKGELGITDLAKLRGRPTRPARANAGRPRLTVKTSGEALLKACAREPDVAEQYLEALIAQLQAYLPSQSEVV